MSSQFERTFQVSDAVYPFADHWYERDGAAMHYLDEGEGMPVLLLHGNPTWSFLYREVIKGLRQRCRLIAPDYPGFGFSQHPAGYSYLPRDHAAWVDGLIEHLALERFILVVQDWGGPIGLSVAGARPERVAGVLLLNTWAWPADLNMWFFSAAVGGPLGRYLNLRRNFFARQILPRSLRGPSARDPEVLEAYAAPFPTRASRMGTWVFPREIRRSSEWLGEVESRLPLLKDKPMEMLWAARDPAFGNSRVIGRWQEIFPGIPLKMVEGAGHYIQEDAPEEVVQGVVRLLAAAGARGAGA